MVRQQGNGHLQRNTYHNLTREVTIRKRVALLSLILIAVLLTGCSPRLEFSITPNPISVTFETEEIELEAKVKMYGFGSYKIEQAALEILDDQGEPVFEEPKVYDINKTVTVVPLGSIGKPVPLARVRMSDLYDEILDGEELSEELYDELKGKTYTIKITLTGTGNPSSQAKLEFK